MRWRSWWRWNESPWLAWRCLFLSGSYLWSILRGLKLDIVFLFFHRRSIGWRILLWCSAMRGIWVWTVLWWILKLNLLFRFIAGLNCTCVCWNWVAINQILLCGWWRTPILSLIHFLLERFQVVRHRLCVRLGLILIRIYPFLLVFVWDTRLLSLNYLLLRLLYVWLLLLWWMWLFKCLHLWNEWSARQLLWNDLLLLLNLRRLLIILTEIWGCRHIILITTLTIRNSYF